MVYWCSRWEALQCKNGRMEVGECELYPGGAAHYVQFWSNFSIDCQGAIQCFKDWERTYHTCIKEC